ncbi:geranylgeranyl diphosphate synthase type II [Bacilli bacterium PM5-3]|nr:geranylgeranyl diphosphate synthase type II [Bacilli bacterium PM5-3]MDH6603065.1 geranylgeranyl diphosphate synthase type II [Bacilli bacterium PM5-9]
MSNELNIKSYEIEVNNILANMLNENVQKDSKIKASMVYSLLDGGKRIRPILFMMLLEQFNIDYKKYENVICAIEMVHTYSLVHDDLPGMDNDTLRRGKPTTHIKFGEATAILCGDALLTDAFYLLTSMDIDPQLSLKLIRTLSLAAGSNGMIYGQQKDLDATKDMSITDIEHIYYYKTCLLIQASLAMAAIIADKQIDDFMSLGAHLGQAFQIQDDILEQTKTSQEIGKNINSDQKNEKATIVEQIGVEKANLLVESYFDQIEVLLDKLQLSGTKFHLLILEIANRKL